MLNTNLYAQFKNLLVPGVLQVGSVTTVDNGIATLALPGGASVRARGNVAPGDTVFVRDGVIQGPAPSLALVVMEI